MIYSTSDRAHRALLRQEVGGEAVRLAGGFLVERTATFYRLYHHTRPAYWVQLGSPETVLSAWEREAKYVCLDCAGDGCEACSGAGRVVEARLDRAIAAAEAVLR